MVTQLDALVVRVEQEGAEAVGHVVVGQELQVVLTELKLHGELEVDLRVEGQTITQEDILKQFTFILRDVR